MGILKDYIIAQAEKKKMPPKEWLENTLALIDKCTLATHIGKFSHPDSRVSILDYNHDGVPGYISNGGTCCGYDISINAAYLSISNLLLLRLENGRSVLEGIVSEPTRLNVEVNQWHVDFNNYVNEVETILHGVTVKKTEDILKQVYFPIDKGEYNVLTVLPSSCILMELGSRLKAMRARGVACKNKKDELYGESYTRIMNQTAISYGGTKPQNISTMNSKTGGTHYMLETLPPVWQIKARLPKVNFFGDAVYTAQIRSELTMLHKLFVADWNNMHIRDGIDRLVDTIVDRVMQKAIILQSEAPGWSSSRGSLPKEQCIWLDNIFVEFRQNDDFWIKAVCRSFGRWLIQNYEKTVGKKAVALGNDELEYFAERLEAVLQEERRYTK